MKFLLVLFSVFFSLHAYCQEDYTVKVNDSTFDMSLDKDYNLVVNGQKINFKVRQKDTLTYHDDMFSFYYPKGVKVSTTVISDGVEQIAILTAEGSGLLIQKYKFLNPTSLNELMLNELTKESLSYGYNSKKTNFKKTLKSGHIAEVTKAVLQYKDETNIYEIASLGKKDAGIIVVTIRMDDNDNSEGKKIIDLMWKTLSVKF